MAVILIDDNQTNLMLMSQLVNQIEGAEVLSFLDPMDALKRMPEVDVELVIVDYLMPHMDGLQLIEHVRRRNRMSDVPIVMVTTAEQRTVRLAALDAGATDFISKPIDPAEFRARIRNLLQISKAQASLKGKAQWLAQEVAKVTAHLATQGEELVQRMERIAALPDPDSGVSGERMARLCRLTAEGLGMPAAFCRNIELAAPLHDYKSSVPAEEAHGNGVVRLPVGGRSGAVDADGAVHGPTELMTPVPDAYDLVQLVAEIAISHHERWDGSGYPLGLKGDAIALSGRIAAVAGVFDALTSPRPFKRIWSFEEARRWISDKRGSHFDPQCVQAFLSRWDEIVGMEGGATARKGVA